jgi:hypothetical protein
MKIYIMKHIHGCRYKTLTEYKKIKHLVSHRKVKQGVACLHYLVLILISDAFDACVTFDISYAS